MIVAKQKTLNSYSSLSQVLPAVVVSQPRSGRKAVSTFCSFAPLFLIYFQIFSLIPDKLVNYVGDPEG